MTAQTIATGVDGAVGAGLEGQIEMLARRLEKGWRVIEQRADAGEPITDLENYWLSLLADYEALQQLNESDN